MELLSNDALWGCFFFLLGVLTLTRCNSLDQKNYYKVRGLRRLELYGRREGDAKATLPLAILCGCLPIAGSGFALYGLFRFFIAVL